MSTHTTNNLIAGTGVNRGVLEGRYARDEKGKLPYEYPNKQMGYDILY